MSEIRAFVYKLYVKLSSHATVSRQIEHDDDIDMFGLFSAFLYNIDSRIRAHWQQIIFRVKLDWKSSFLIEPQQKRIENLILKKTTTWHWEPLKSFRCVLFVSRSWTSRSFIKMFAENDFHCARCNVNRSALTRSLCVCLHSLCSFNKIENTLETRAHAHNAQTSAKSGFVYELRQTLTSLHINLYLCKIALKCWFILCSSFVCNFSNAYKYVVQRWVARHFENMLNSSFIDFTEWKWE